MTLKPRDTELTIQWCCSGRVTQHSCVFSGTPVINNIGAANRAESDQAKPTSTLHRVPIENKDAAFKYYESGSRVNERSRDMGWAGIIASDYFFVVLSLCFLCLSVLYFVYFLNVWTVR